MNQQQKLEVEKERFYFHSEPGLARAVQTKASSCGKAIIVGEHAVVYGSTAVAMPLTNHGMQIKLTPTPTNEVKLILEGRELSNHLCGVIDDAFAALQIKKFGLVIEGRHSLPLGAGLGSSASLCIVILRALSSAVGMNLSNAKLAELGNILERRFHGTPSGLDTAVVAYDQAISFRRGHGAEPLKLTTDKKDAWRFLVIDSGVRSSTIAMIKQAEPYFKSEMGDRRVAIFDNLSKQVVSGLTLGDRVQVADAMNHAGAMLAQAGVVNEVLQNIIDECLAKGALAAKPTGAGGGGSVIALFGGDEDPRNISELKTSLNKLNIFPVELT